MARGGPFTGLQNGFPARLIPLRAPFFRGLARSTCWGTAWRQVNFRHQVFEN